MASILKVDKLDPQSGTALEIGTSGDTITVPSGATFNVAGTLQSGGAALVTGKIGAVTISPNITTGQASTTSTSYADSGTTVISLTPSATSSKIWVSYTFNFDAGADGQGVSSAIYADINGAGYNNIDSTGQFADYNDLGNGTRLRQWVTLNSLYSPSTTSIVNFKLYWKTSAGTAYLNLKTVKIVLLEVLA